MHYKMTGEPAEGREDYKADCNQVAEENYNAAQSLLKPEEIKMLMDRRFVSDSKRIVWSETERQIRLAPHKGAL